MRRTRSRLDAGRDEHGSALIASLVVIFITAMLGLAMFNLGVLEGRLVYTSQGDARAFEIAQAGVTRALSKLQATMSSDLSWASGSTALCTGGSHRGCSDSQFYPAASSYISNLNFDSGSYSIEFRQATAQTLSVPCADSTVTSDVDPTKKICKDLIFVRVTGTLPNNPEGYSPTRTIQLLAQAVPGDCLICGGIRASASTGMPINGNVRIAGSIQITGVEGTAALSFGGGAGQSNSYALLDSNTSSPFGSLERVTPLPLVCPLGRTCSGSTGLVESLGATLKVAHPINVPAVTLSGSAYLGQNGNQSYPGGTRNGKGPLDGILVADGCTMPCTDNFTGVTLNSNTFVDDNNITKPYLGSTGAFPLLSDAWRVNGVQYTHFACVSGSSCTPPGSPTTQEYFVSRAGNIMTLPSSNCVPSPGCAPIITALSSTGLSAGVNPFEIWMTFVNQSGSTVTGKICWDRANPSLPPGVSAGPAGLPRLTLEFGSPDCNTPTPVSDPLLVYMPSSTPTTTGFTVNRSGGPSDYSYRGAAIIVTNGLVQIEESLQTCLTSGPPCAGHLFTRDDSLTVLTTGNMNLGANASNIHRIMGLFYAGGIETSQKETNILGSITAFRLCFAGGSSPCSAGGNVPSFFQVSPDPSNLVATITTGATFSVAPVRAYWIECKRTPNADGTFQALPTGFCPYTP